MAKTNLTRWRFLAGAAHGVILWSLAVFAITAAVDRRIWTAVHRDPNGQLAYDLWYGRTPEAFHGLLVTASLAVIPVCVLLQIRPPVAALATRRLALWTAALAVLLAAAAVFDTWQTALSWLWVLQD